MELIIIFIMYLLGSLLVMVLAEPEQGNEGRFTLFVLLWPAYTVFFAVHEMIHGDPEDDNEKGPPGT